MSSYVFVIIIVAMSLSFVTFWIVLGRKDNKRTAATTDEDYDLAEISRMADSLSERIDILESILDAEVPDWRANNEQA